MSKVPDNQDHTKRDRDYGMYPDDLAWQRGDEAVAAFVNSVYEPGVKESIIDMIVKYRGGNAVQWHPPARGSYNCCFALELDTGWAAMRVPLPGRNAFSDEKTRTEVHTMRYIAQNTTIPVPHVYHWGLASENPTGLGPFIIMDYFPDTDTLSQAMRDPFTKPGESYVLNTSLSDEKLEELYRPMANIVLQLYALKMSRIGSLVCTDDGGDSWVVGTRPLLQNHLEVVTTGGCPASVLPPEETTFATSREFYTSLADLHMAHLAFQHNDAVESDDDCRDKYMARHLFRQLARRGHLTKGASKPETFRFIGDDLSPSNVLIDKESGKLVAVIDWEFSYFGPDSFASSPPWWLLLRKPEYWDIGDDIFDDWASKYPRCLDVFLNALKAEEKEMKAAGGRSVEEKLEKLSIAPDEEPLSVRMRKNWESGNFWFNWAARKSYALDPVFWKHMDERFFGENKRGGYEDRLALLSRDEKETMEWIVGIKMVESKENKLIDWRPEDAQSYLRHIIGRRRV